MHLKKISISRVYYSFIIKDIILGTLVYKKVACQMGQIIQHTIWGQLDSHSEKGEVGVLNHTLLHNKSELCIVLKSHCSRKHA